MEFPRGQNRIVLIASYERAEGFRAAVAKLMLGRGLSALKPAREQFLEDKSEDFSYKNASLLQFHFIIISSIMGGTTRPRIEPVDARKSVRTTLSWLVL